jgi:hypothetical protein
MSKWFFPVWAGILIMVTCSPVFGLKYLNESDGKIQSIVPAPPTHPVRVIFIHHSTGENWLSDENGGLGIALRENNYFVSDTNYGWGPTYPDHSSTIGDHTDIGNWWEWFRGPNSSTYLNALYNEGDQHSSYSRLSTAPTGKNEVIMFKSCFPNSALQGDPSDPVPSIDNNPVRGEGSGSEYHTIANAKGIYIDLLEYFRSQQDKLFIVITAPPLMASDTNTTEAANARAFNNWLVNDWLTGYPYKNVAVFDFYNVLTSNGGNANTNDVGWESGNHHRWWNGAIQHIQTENNNTAAYPSGDSHPSQAGNLKATGEFLPLLNVAYRQWKVELAETISTPSTAIGSTSGVAGVSYNYSTDGADSSLDHSVQYLFDWGDGSNSGWLPLGQTSASHFWTSSGTYLIKVQAQCATDTNVISDWSGSLSVTISAAALSYTVTANPIGLQIIVDGSTYTTPHTFSWPSGSTHALSVSSPQNGTLGTRYVYSSWSDGGAQTHTVTVPSSGTTYTATFSTQYQLTITSSPPAGGTVTPSPMGDQSGIACPALVGVICPGYYFSGTLVTLTATPNTDYYIFSGWSGDVSDTDNPASITMNGPKNVVANFTQDQYTLTVNIAPPGSGSVAKNPDKATYTYGDQVQLRAAANLGFTFSNWTNDVSSSTNPITLTMDGNRTITANFTELIGPDLTGEWLIPVIQTCKNTRKGQKCTIKGTFTVNNSGNRDSISTSVSFYLSDDGVTYQEEDLIKRVSLSKIKADRSKVLKLSYSLPVDQSASGRYIIAVIDKDDIVKEIDEGNNIIVFGPIQ